MCMVGRETGGPFHPMSTGCWLVYEFQPNDHFHPEFPPKRLVDQIGQIPGAGERGSHEADIQMRRE